MIPILPNPLDKFTKEQVDKGFSRILTIEDSITEEDAANLLAYVQHQTPSTSNRNEQNFSVLVDTWWLPEHHPIYKVIEKHWRTAIDFFNFDITFIEPYEIKKYSLGGHFGRHIDNYHAMSIPVERKITMSLQLSEDTDYVGGRLTIVRTQVSRKKLSMTFFPSFYPHGVEAITNGTRWVMIGWAWGPYWR